LPTFYVNNAANISINRRKNAVIVLFFHRNGMDGGYASWFFVKS